MPKPKAAGLVEVQCRCQVIVLVIQNQRHASTDSKEGWLPLLGMERRGFSGFAELTERRQQKLALKWGPRTGSRSLVLSQVRRCGLAGSRTTGLYSVVVNDLLILDVVGYLGLVSEI